MYRNRFRFQGRPVDDLVMTLKSLLENPELQVLAAAVEIHEEPSKEEDRSTRVPSPPAPIPQVRMFMPHALARPEFAVLANFIDVDAFGMFTSVSRIFDWIIYGYDEMMKGALMAKLEEAGLLIEEVVVRRPIEGKFPILRGKYASVLLVDPDHPPRGYIMTHAEWGSRQRR